MANFVVVVDPAPARRGDWIGRALGRLAPVPGLVSRVHELGDCAVAWAASPDAPVSCSVTDDALAVVWGDAIVHESERRLDAPSLLSPGRAAADVSVPYDGYHVCLSYDASRGLALTSDLLGLFPVYFASAGQVLVAGSSPELFRVHPLFPPSLDAQGLCGILLAGCAIERRTLWRGVKRLHPAHCLRWTPAAGVRELELYRMPLPEPERGGLDEHVDRLHAALGGAMRRHAPAHLTHGLLLSGGLDSRLFAGYLARDSVTVDALTFGKPTDYETRCAVPVARALGFRHSVAAIPDAEYAGAAALQARWEHLATGFSTVHMWAALPFLRRLPPRLVNGYLGGSFLSRSSLLNVRIPFDVFFPRFNLRGIERLRLKKLLRDRSMSDEVDATVERLRALYDTSCSDESQRTWRFHIANTEPVGVGSVPWRLSFAAWPVLPILDRAVLDVVGSLPDQTLARRRAQNHLLCTRFPHLARLPLDRNNLNTLPLMPTAAARMRSAITRPAAELRHRLDSTYERRRFFRIYDFDGEGWRKIRRVAEPHRGRLADLFDMEELGRLLPPPDTALRLRHPIQDAHGRKLLVGLMIWAAEHGV